MKQILLNAFLQGVEEQQGETIWPENQDDYLKDVKLLIRATLTGCIKYRAALKNVGMFAHG